MWHPQPSFPVEFYLHSFFLLLSPLKVTRGKHGLTPLFLMMSWFMKCSFGKRVVMHPLARMMFAWIISLSSSIMFPSHPDALFLSAQICLIHFFLLSDMIFLSHTNSSSVIWEMWMVVCHVIICSLVTVINVRKRVRERKLKRRSKKFIQVAFKTFERNPRSSLELANSSASFDSSCCPPFFPLEIHFSCLF